jgi:hypothetical protein
LPPPQRPAAALARKRPPRRRRCCHLQCRSMRCDHTLDHAAFSFDTHAVSSRDRGPDQPQRRCVRAKPRPRVSTATLQGGPYGLLSWASHVMDLLHSGGKQPPTAVSRSPHQCCHRQGAPTDPVDSRQRVNPPLKTNHPDEHLNGASFGAGPVLPPGPRRPTNGRSLTAPVILEPRGARPSLQELTPRRRRL